MDIYIYRNEQREGPYTLVQINAALELGSCSSSDLAWIEGWEDWQPLSSVPGLKRFTPPPAPSVIQHKTDSRKPRKSNKNYIYKITVFIGILIAIFAANYFKQDIYHSDNNLNEQKLKQAEADKNAQLEKQSQEFYINVIQVLEGGVLADRLTKHDLDLKNKEEKRQKGMSEMEIVASDTSKKASKRNAVLLDIYIKNLRMMQENPTTHESYLKNKEEADHLEDLHSTALREDELCKELGTPNEKYEDREQDIIYIQGNLAATNNQLFYINAYRDGSCSYRMQNNATNNVERWILKTK